MSAQLQLWDAGGPKVSFCKHVFGSVGTLLFTSENMITSKKDDRRVKVSSYSTSVHTAASDQVLYKFYKLNFCTKTLQPQLAHLQPIRLQFVSETEGQLCSSFKSCTSVFFCLFLPCYQYCRGIPVFQL